MRVISFGLEGFFDEEDAAATQRQAPEEFKPPAWMQAPADELPVRLLHDVAIAETDAAVLVLREVRVFSIGFEVLVDWFMRRRTDDLWEWQQLTESATRGGWSRFGPGRRDTGLRFGLALPDGQKLRPVGVALGMVGSASPEPPTLMPRDGGGGGGPDLVSGSHGIWVWSPEPIHGALTFVTEWAQLDIPVTGAVLDGGEIAVARSGVRPLWGFA
jgi:hypothetical protein